MQPQLIAGRYQVLRAIGHGGMGTVWLCRDEILGREVAVKQIGALPGESATETKRAMREARSAAALNHPNAVAVYDVVTHDGRPWLVMEYVEGQTLADEIARDGMLSPQRVADIGSQLAGALARAHERLIVHRDIKPGNVLIDKAGRPKISDFGIARGHGDEKLTQIGFITGTPGFLSPELARGADPASASDVWALGATLYAAVEGQQPYEPRSNPIALLRAIATERPRPMTHAGALRPAIEAMMDADPARRWDMATSARRLGGIARITTLIALPPVDATQVLVATPPLDATQTLESTQALEPTQAITAVASQAGARPAVVRPVAKPEVAQPEVAQPEVAQPEVVVLPVAKPEVVTPPVAKPPVAKPPVVTPPVVPPPVVKPEVAKPEVAKPAVVRPAVVGPAVAKVAPADMRAGAVAETAVAGHPATQASAEVYGGPPVPPVNDNASGRRWVPFVLVALLLAVLGIGYQIIESGSGGNTGTTAAPKVTQPRATPSATSTTTEAPAATTAAPPPTTAASGPQADKKLQEFVRSYYSQVTGNRGRSWAQLTPRMQVKAGGRSGYDGFWSTIRKVAVTNVVANASANTATVYLTYTHPNGSTESESRTFTLVSQGGGYLIDTDRRG